MWKLSVNRVMSQERVKIEVNKLLLCANKKVLYAASIGTTTDDYS